MTDSKKTTLFNKKRERALIITAMTLLLCTAIALIPVFAPTFDEIYDFVCNAIDNSESQDSFQLQLTMASEVAIGSNSTRIDTTGYIISDNNMEDVLVYVNTFSTSSDTASSDYDVTVSLYSDGEKVYDNSTGTNVEVDVTAEEFEEIMSTFSLYQYNRSDVTSVSFSENENDDFGEKSGNVTINLKTPGETVLSSYAELITQIAGEDITTSELNVEAANITYGIYYDMVTAQYYTFAVSCTLSNGEKLTYTVTSQVAYNTELISENDEDYEYYIQQEVTTDAT